MAKAVSRDGTVIAYDKKGDGPLLILVLGALNRRGQGKKLTAELADRFTVVSYDRRGRGDSTDVLPYSPEKEVDDIRALVEALGGTAYLYGHSSGCVLVLLAAQALGARVAGIALYELPYNADPEAQAVAREYRARLAEALAHGRPGEAVALFVKSVGVTDKQVAAMERLPMWKGLTAMAHTLAYDTTELMQRYPTLDLARIPVPAIVMYGGDSPAFMSETAQHLAEVLPTAQLRPIPGQAHDVAATAVAPELAEFFGRA